MDTPKAFVACAAPRSALKNVSNSQKASARTPSLAERHKTPTRPSYAGQSTSAKRIKMSIRRQLSKSYGDLSHLRPKSPPIQNPSVGFQGLQLSPGNYVDDVQNLFSPNYNRQGRQTIPSDWRTNRLDQQRPAAAERSTPTSLPTNKSQRFRPISPSDNNKKCRIGSGPITIPIRGLASEFLQPLDFFVTVRRLHPNNEGRKYETLQKHASQAPVVEHVDISTTWIGLEYIDAEELFRIHRSFCKKFDEILARELWHVYHQLQQQDSVGNINPVPSLYTDGIVRGIAFCRNQLHDAMADALYSTVEEIERSQSGLLRLYLAARDCLEQYHEDSSRDASVIIRMRCDQSSPIAYPIVEAAWVPDSLVFENLDEFPCEGREFLVIPRYLSKSAFRPARFPTNVKYSIESQPSLLSWLVWDGRIGGFRGTVPTFSDKMDYTGCYTNRSCKSCGGSIYNKLAFVVRAVLSDDNGSSIGYQKTLRARLTIKVVPWYANDIVHELHPRFPQPKAYQQTKITAADQNFGYMILDSISQKVGLSIRPSSRLKEDTAQQVDDHQSPWKLSRQYLLSNRDLEHTRPNLNAIAVHGSGLAQIHNLASNSVDFGSVKDADKQDMILNTLEDLQAQATHVSSPLVYFTNDRNVLAYRDYHTQFASGSSARCCTSEDALGRHIVPHSPVLSGRATALDPTLSPSFAALPPPAFGLVPFFESVDGSWGSCKGSAPWDPLDDVDKTRYPRLQPKRSFATPSATASSTCESRCSKRHARSSLTRPSLSQRSNETTKKPGYATSACHAEQLLNTNSTMVFNDGEMSTRINRSCPLSQNSFGPLHDLRNSTTITTKSVDRSPTYSPRDSTPGVWDVENVTVKAERDVEHQKQDSGCYVDLDDSISDTDEVRVQNPRPNDPNGFLFSGSANSNPLTPPNHVADFRVGKEPPLNFAFFDRQRVANSQIETSNSVSPWDTEASSCSSTRASSSSLDVIVEQDPQIRKDSRREQAILWQLLSQSESDKENQPQTMKEEARLSGEEKSAMAEAMQRSLGDLAGTFDDIFLTDNCESNSGDGL